MQVHAWGKKRPKLLLWLLFGLLVVGVIAACSSLSIGKSSVTYQPPQPTQAPEDIREAVLLGQNILNDPQKYVANHVGNEMKCSNCHFNAGMTQGGKNGGISLVGVGATYPQYRDRQKYAVNMVTRLNDWMQRSENGKVLPFDSKEMTAMVTYLQWISKDIPVYADVPWLGVGKMKNYKEGDKEVGKTVYSSKCSACHGPDGQGTTAAPAVWGDKSYNDGAGMSKPETLANFALLNMPRGNPTLTQEEAQNVAAFVDSQPRPHFVKPSSP